jgi:hypothetical protein
MWQASSSPVGIAGYEVRLEAYENGSWFVILDQQVPDFPTELDISDVISKYLGDWFTWEVVAKDKNGIWGAWSPWDTFKVVQCIG